jgi:hypothetical protein
MAITVTGWVKNSVGFRETTFGYSATEDGVGTSEDYPDHIHTDMTIVFNPIGTNYAVASTLSWKLQASYDGGGTYVDVISESAKVIDSAAYRYYYDRDENGALPKFRITVDPSAQLDGSSATELKVIIIPN